MRRLSPVKLLAIGMTLLFVLLCGGVFVQRNGREALWRVTASRKESPQSVSVVQEETWPVSLLPEERINLNTASVKDLTRLPQIGEKRGADIAAWREEHGPFLTPEDLMKVPGIGEGIFAQIERYITVENME